MHALATLTRTRWIARSVEVTGRTKHIELPVYCSSVCRERRCSSVGLAYRRAVAVLVAVAAATEVPSTSPWGC